MELFAENPELMLAIAFGLYMAWAIGANDLANPMGPAVGAKAFGLRHAIVIAAIFEFMGALFYGSHVTDTLRSGVIDTAAIDGQSELLIYGMLASLLAAAIWLTFATMKGWPVSTTHSIIGAMVGFAVAGIGLNAVHWQRIIDIVASWIVSPLVGGVFGYILMQAIVLLILKRNDPVKSAQRWAPLFIFLAGFLVIMTTLYGGMKLLGIELSLGLSITVSSLIGLGLVFMGKISMQSFDRTNLEQIFIPMTLFTACAMAFAHGSNDVANVVGPMAVIAEAVKAGGGAVQGSEVPALLYMLGGGGIVLGLATFGFRVVQTIGTRITALTPCRAFCVSLAATATVVLASRSGLPISTTHTVVGAVLGVGLAGGVKAVDAKIIKQIAVSWVVTLPVTALLAAFFYSLSLIL